MPEPSNRQEDFGAGIYRGREAPWNAVYDAVNCLIDDEGQLFRRGGSAYFTATNPGYTIGGLGDVFLPPGRRLLVWGLSASDDLSVLDEGAVAFRSLDPLGAMPFSRIVPAGGVVGLYRNTSLHDELLLYAGSLKAADYSTGTVTTTNGSQVVTGSGTSWLANVDPGMFFAGGTPWVGVVASVDSNTQVTLRDPYTGASGSGGGGNFTRVVFLVAPVPAPYPALAAAAAVGSPPRILFCAGNRAYFTEPGKVQLVAANFHELPASEVIVGADSLEDTAILFTTGGVWVIENMAYDALDDVGNIQHRVAKLNELVLWGDSGIAKYQGGLVVPCIDDVYAMPVPGSPVSLSAALRPLYRSYVKAGYQPGTAAVHRGHYFLPILNGTTLVDMLVCRLDRGAAWTRWAGHGASRAYAQRIGASTRSPQLLGIAGTRVTELTESFVPVAGNASEADGTTHALDIITRDYRTPGPGKGSTTTRLRGRYDAAAAATPSVTASYARGLEGASFTALTLVKGGGASDGLDHSVWRVNKQAPAIRFRLQSSSALSSFTLRGIEAQFTRHGLG